MSKWLKDKGAVSVALIFFYQIFFASSTSAGTSSSVNPPSGIVAWWTGDGSTQDLSTNNLVASWLGTPLYVPGKVGQAFNVQNFSLSVANSPHLSFAPGAHATFEFWAMRTSDDLPYHFFGKRVNCTSSVNHQAGVDATMPESPLNEWIHWAVVYDSTGITWYTNGIQYISYPLMTFGNPNAADFRIGRSGTCPRFIGYIDEFTVYNRALSVAEISAIHAAGSAGKLKKFYFAEEPVNQVISCGGSAIFNSLAVNELGNLTYQWQFNGTNLLGQTEADLSILNSSPDMAGVYTVIATSESGQSISASATLGFSFLDIRMYSGLLIQAPIGSECSVQYTENLTPPIVWQTLTNISSLPSNPFFCLDTTPASGGKRFYRVILPPCNP